jgi:hypothetical protein
MSGNGIQINTYYELFQQCKLERDILKKQLELSQKREALLKEALKDLSDNYLFGNSAVYGDMQKSLEEVEEIK